MTILNLHKRRKVCSQGGQKKRAAEVKMRTAAEKSRVKVKKVRVSVESLQTRGKKREHFF